MPSHVCVAVCVGMGGCRCIRASGIEVPKGPLFEQALHVEHRHPLRKQGTGGFSCDVCSGSNGFRYRCEKGCNWGTALHVWLPVWLAVVDGWWYLVWMQTRAIAVCAPVQWST